MRTGLTYMMAIRASYVRSHLTSAVVSKISARDRHILGGKYLHNDLKEDNVLFEDLDNDGCPIGLVLADFGMSAKIGSKTSDLASRYMVYAGGVRWDSESLFHFFMEDERRIKNQIH